MAARPHRSGALLIAPCIPNPCGTGWEKRLHALVQAYARFGGVDLWCQPTIDHPDLRPLFESPELYASIQTFYPSLLFSNEYYLGSALTAAIARASLVHVFRLSEIAAVIDHPLVIWDLDELAREVRDPRRNPGPAAGLDAALSARRADVLEIASRCRGLLVSSAVEVEPWIRPRPEVMPNAVAFPERFQPRWSEEDQTLLFVGNFNFPPNVAAVEVLLEAIWPRLRSARPELCLRLAGRGPRDPALAAWLVRQQDRGGLELIFDPPEIEACYRGARLSLCPLLEGGGTRLKIIEAFAMGCPVVSTRIGAEGLDVVDQEHLLIADDPVRFAESCLRLLAELPLAHRLAERAFAHAALVHDQRAIEARLATLLRGLGWPPALQVGRSESLPGAGA